jgi:DNA (cytosine-5)-methyltransferase 1
MTLRVLDLFSGVGCFSRGLEATGGFRTDAFCETDPEARRVLERHWYDVPIFPDVRTLTGLAVQADVICGGFPCQDISQAGTRKGLEGSRSGLWFEFQRLIGEVRPAYAIIENVTALRRRGLGTILRALMALGYDAEWHCVPAAYIGAPDIRDRLWLIAYPQRPDAHGFGSHQTPLYLRRDIELLNEQERVSGSMVQALSRSLAGVGSAWGRRMTPDTPTPAGSASMRAAQLSGSGWRPSNPPCQQAQRVSE